MLITLFDFSAFAVSLVMMGSMLSRYKKVDTLMILLELSVVIGCFGRFMLAVSQTLDTALWANRLLYVGGCYTPPLLVVVLFKLCNIRCPRLVAAVMSIYSTIVMCLVMSVGYSDLYYKEVSLVVGDGFSRLDKTYGPLHRLYPVMMLIYGMFLLAFLICALKLRKKLSYRVAVVASVMGFSIIMAYVVEQLLDSKVSFLSVGYLLVMLFVIKYFDRLSMYDMSSNVISSVEQRKEYGYIVFDRKFRYISSDSYMKEIFPEINDWAVDARVAPCGSLLYTKVVQYLQQMEWQDADKRIINTDGRYFELDIHPISHGKRHAGYLIEFVDRTLERKYYNSIENYNAELEKEVAVKTADIMHIKDMMVLGMADMVESRDNNTGGHIKRTSEVIHAFSDGLRRYGGGLGLSERFLKQVEKAAPMHDLGKIAIDDRILRKPARYTDEEYAQMKRHTTEGARIVENILTGVEDDEFVRIAKNVALYHHEKWDGGGYPTGISGTDIPVEARIMALADVFDALVSKRCYKEAYSYDKAFSIIEESLGSHFDPKLGQVFLQCRPELEAVYEKYLG